MIKDDVRAMLEDPANLPNQIVDANWVQKIDPDLRSQVGRDDGEDTEGGFVEHPSGLRRRAEQAERRREKKTEAMRKLREEGASRLRIPLRPCRFQCSRSCATCRPR
jgi:hypothetical protein